jgi:hypothetical protein
LLEKGYARKAEQVIRDAAVVNHIDLPHFTLNSEQHEHLKDASYLELIQTKESRAISFPLWTIWGLFGFTYYGLILYVARLYSTEDDGSSCRFDYQSIFINASAELFGVAVCASIIDRFGRIKTQAALYVFSAFFVATLGLPMSISSLLVLAFLGRMAIMAASVSLLLLIIMIIIIIMITVIIIIFIIVIMIIVIIIIFIIVFIIISISVVYYLLLL